MQRRIGRLFAGASVVLSEWQQFSGQDNGVLSAARDSLFAFYA